MLLALSAPPVKAQGVRTCGLGLDHVPDLVAPPDRKTLGPMDVVAVLTRVVQEQQVQIDELQRQLEQLRMDRPQRGAGN